MSVCVRGAVRCGVMRCGVCVCASWRCCGRWVEGGAERGADCPLPVISFALSPPQIILRVAAGNGVSKVVVGKDAIMATPAMSALIRRRSLYGGLIMSASHNPGGPGQSVG